MFHRFSTWWRALGVVLLSLATVTWPSAAQAGTTPSFSLTHQDAWTALSTSDSGSFSVTLALTHPQSPATVELSLYPRLITRSQLAPVVSGAGVHDAAVASTGPVSLQCPSARPATFSVTLYATSAPATPSPCSHASLRLRLPCRGQSCAGVYPLRYLVTSEGVTTSECSMIAVEAGAVSSPLRVVWTSTLDDTSVAHASQALDDLRLFARYPALPLTIGFDYRALNDVLAHPAVATWKGALKGALSSASHRAISAPPAAIDYAGLVSAGLGSQITSQLSLAGQLLRQLGVTSFDSPVLVSGTASAASLDALGGAGVRDVVIPESTLSLAPSTTLNWGAPFHVTNARVVTALATDQPLTQLISSTSIEPGRRAALVLATLAFLHFQEPNAPATRSVVVNAPLADTSSAFLSQMLTGLSSNPFFRASTLSGLFSSSLVGTNGAPNTRTMAASVTSTWSSLNVSSLTSLISNVNSFSQAASSPSVVNGLRVATALCEVAGTSDARQSLIDASTARLNAQLSQFSVDAGAITLAGPGTALPITLLSRANYTVTAVVHLITDRLGFPKGHNIAVTLDAPTKSIRVPTSNHRGSDLTLQVRVTTPDGQLTLARAAIQVRIAGTSVVGYVLSLGSLLVLALWWIRTVRRRSKGRHAR